MSSLFDHYRPRAQHGDPDISPLRASDLSGLPPALIVTAEYDVLSRRRRSLCGIGFAEAGVPVTWQLQSGRPALMASRACTTMSLGGRCRDPRRRGRDRHRLRQSRSVDHEAASDRSSSAARDGPDPYPVHVRGAAGHRRIRIAEQAIDAAKAGAAIPHLHARNEADGSPSPAPEDYMLRLCRASGRLGDVVVNITGGGPA